MESAPGKDPGPWRFGVEPLAQTSILASLMRRVAGLAISMERADPAVDRLIEELRNAERVLVDQAPADPAPRVGPNPSDAQRVYVDHSEDIGSYNPCFPEYNIEVAGDRAEGTVAFPLAYEGPPGIVHGGFLAVFFDCVIQDQNCELGQTGQTVSLNVSYRRPTPLLKILEFEIDRLVAERRIRSNARLSLDGVTLCTAAVDAVLGDRAALPDVSPRRMGP
jgi:acyl-coenzyme A thioesterase PaaI-like protein